MVRVRFKIHRLRAMVMVTFGFSRSEARAFIILLPLIFVIVFIQPVYQSLFTSGKPDLFADRKQLDSLLATFEWDTITTQDPGRIALFRFNPNTVTAEEMDSLGIPESVAQRIERYRSKGGKFRRRSDLQKIYGFDTALFRKLEPQIELPVAVTSVKKSTEKYARLPLKAEHAASKAKQIFDLNVADTTVFDDVYGIGPTLARRIVAYRDRLGGFLSEEQLYEVWGLDSAVARRVMEQGKVAVGFVPRTISINAAPEKDLASHPYIKPKMARLIVAYRFQHGNFLSIEDLGKIYSFEPKTFDRIKPYLTLE